jgi:hypothetical protein
MNRHKLLSLVTALALCAPGFAQGEVDLKVTTKKGASVWLLEETKQSQVIDMQGQEMETEQKTSKFLQFTVKDVDDKGVMTIETRIVRIQGSMGLPMGMGDMEFDSAAPESNEEEDDGGMGMGAMMSGLKKSMMAGVGKSFTAKVDAKGKVVELMDDAKELLKDSGGGGGRMMNGPALTEEALKDLVSSAFGEMPEKPIAVGAEWQRDEKEAGGRMPSQNKFKLTLAKADAESFEITIAGTVEKLPMPENAGDDTIEGDDEQAAMQREMMKSMQLKNGKIAGVCKVSRVDGFVTEANNTISMDVEMSAGPVGDMAMALKISKSLKRTTEAAAAPKTAAPKTDEAKPATPTTGGGK